MSKDLNNCNFIGRLGNDVDMRYTAGGSAVANLSLACSDDYKDKTSGAKVEQTNWIRVVAFGKLAEIMGEYLRKGSQVYISGKQVTRKWQDKEGADRYTTEIVANEMQMLGGKGSSAGDSAASNGSYQKPQESPSSGSGGNPTQNNPAPGAGSADDFDNDIPFDHFERNTFA